MKEPLLFLICYKFAKIAREKEVHFFWSNKKASY